jgi:hypothetical protein
MISSMKRLILSLGATVGLLALGAPAAAHASTHLASAAHASQGEKVPDVGSNGISYPIGGCTFVVGDYRTANAYASGEADIKCPTGYNYNYQIKVYLDYAVNGKWRTLKSRSVSFYGTGGTYWDVATPGWCAQSWQNPNQYWATAAEISFNGGAWYGFYWSHPNWYAAPYC